MTEKRVREGRAPLAYTNDCEGVLFTHEVVCARWPFAGKVAKGQMIAVEVLMGFAVGVVEDCEGKAR